MKRLSDSHRRDLPSGNSTLTSMREEEVGAARRAVIGDQNVCELNAGACKLILRDGNKIEARRGNMIRSVTGRVSAEEENGMPVGNRFRTIGQRLEEAFRAHKFPVERFHNFLTHVVTTSSN